MKKLFYVTLMLLLSGITFAQKDILINWECNMEFEKLSGRYNTADTVAARGDFNSWGRHDLIPDPGDPNYYISAVPDTAFDANVGDTIVAGYKFFYTPAVWETGDNRIYVLTQDDYDAGEAYISRPFNDGSISTLTNQESVVTFKVDVNGAVSYINGQPFTVINSVRIAGGVAPLQWPGGGWPDGDIGLTLPLTDQGGGIWSADITFPIYTPFSIPYKYGINYGDAANNGGGNDNEAGVGSNHIITLFPSFWNGVVDNAFGTMGNHTFTTDVNEIPGSTPVAYALEQNFPNPFNPTTTINFSIPVEGFVAIDVYNSIGQKVASLVNETKTAGSYTVGFDASDLTSGIYFYKITSGNFSETKKMILLK
jgi:hypothetical protein